MVNKIQTLAAMVSIFSLLVAVLALMRDTFREKKMINVYSSTASWYWTDICVTMGVTDSSQVTFQSK
jgi:hypothetical protein